MLEREAIFAVFLSQPLSEQFLVSLRPCLKQNEGEERTRLLSDVDRGADIVRQRRPTPRPIDFCSINTSQPPINFASNEQISAMVYSGYNFSP